jgi:hypothetical protein
MDWWLDCWLDVGVSWGSGGCVGGWTNTSGTLISSMTSPSSSS